VALQAHARDFWQSARVRASVRWMGNCSGGRSHPDEDDGLGRPSDYPSIVPIADSAGSFNLRVPSPLPSDKSRGQTPRTPKTPKSQGSRKTLAESSRCSSRASLVDWLSDVLPVGRSFDPEAEPVTRERVDSEPATALEMASFAHRERMLQERREALEREKAGADWLGTIKERMPSMSIAGRRRSQSTVPRSRGTTFTGNQGEGVAQGGAAAAGASLDEGSESLAVTGHL